MTIIWKGNNLKGGINDMLKHKNESGQFVLLRRCNQYYISIVTEENWRREIKGFTLLDRFPTTLDDNQLQKRVALMDKLAVPQEASTK
jgi:hypothetical protein